MHKFLEMYTLPRLNQEAMENMNRLIATKEIESVKKKKIFSTNKSPGPHGVIGKFYYTILKS